MAAARRDPRLQRLVRRGLTLKLSDPMGPHSKYFPYVNSERDHTTPLVTCDDDTFYPRWWLERLVASEERDDANIYCYRAYRTIVDGGRVAPYSMWAECESTEPSFRNCLTSVSGQIYPPRFLDFLRNRGEAFMDVSPRNDDLWVHACSVAAGIRTAQVFARARLFLAVPGSARHGLFNTNAVENDRVTEKLYDTNRDHRNLIVE